jgi:uncharacterized protein
MTFRVRLKLRLSCRFFCVFIAAAFAEPTMPLAFLLRRLPVVLYLLAGSLGGAIPPTPQAGDFLHDLAGLLTADELGSLRTRQREVFQQTQIPIVVVTVPAMNQYVPGSTSIETFARLWFNTWGIGSQRKNDGILVIVSRNDRRARIELGVEWGRRWDNYAQHVMNERMVPRFKTGNYGAGLIAGMEALARAAQAGPKSEPPAPSALEKFMASPVVKFARENNPLMERYGKWAPLLLLVGGLLVVAGLVIPEYRWKLIGLGLGLIGLVVLFWVVAIILAFLFRGSSRGSSGGGGGGFGGGSSGGGGASGSW